MHELDFFQVDTTQKSADAIAIRFNRPDFPGRQAIAVVDGGYAEFGERVVEHVLDVYRTDHVDLVLSTHPHADHLTGLQVVLSRLRVAEFAVHRPRLHRHPRNPWSDTVEELVTLARRRGTRVVEPFADGAARWFGGAVQVLGPTQSYYEELLVEIAVQQKVAAQLARAQEAPWLTLARHATRRPVSVLPPETLVDDHGGTDPCNNTSVILNLVLDGQRYLLTGDAGVPALGHALDVADVLDLSGPLQLVQLPHHGSRHNVDRDLLNRLLGHPGQINPTVVGIVSASPKDEDHPSPQVTNAFQRRGAQVFTTEQGSLWYHRGTPDRPNYGPAAPLGPLEESDE